jgi:hypothetical protein
MYSSIDGTFNAIPMIPSNYDIYIHTATGICSIWGYVLGGSIRHDSGRADVPALLQFVDIRTIPVKLYREGTIRAVVQLKDLTEMYLDVFWDQVPSVDHNDAVFGIIITTYEQNDLSIMLLRQQG